MPGESNPDTMYANRRLVREWHHACRVQNCRIGHGIGNATPDEAADVALPL